MFTIYPVLAGAIPDSLFYVRSAVTYRSDRLITYIPYTNPVEVLSFTLILKDVFSYQNLIDLDVSTWSMRLN